jgi:BirA family transcriptional regulator, biotin operon repressor / biotin---[acetyl-CoA-carboxylase] ligase
LDHPSLDAPRLLAETFAASVEHYVELPSTNDQAKLRGATDPCPMPLLVVADRQTAGRGRGVNRWWSGPGSLTFSLLVPPERLPADRAVGPLVALAAGVAVVECLAPLAEPQELGLHWPNDIFAAGRKLGGILIEALANGRHVVGIGLNVNNRLDEAPGEIRAAAVSLAEIADRTFDLTGLLIDLLESLDRQLRLLCESPAQVAGRADALCLQRGRTLTLELTSRRITGRCLGIGIDGGLTLDTAEGPQSFHSGVVRQ